MSGMLFRLHYAPWPYQSSHAAHPLSAFIAVCLLMAAWCVCVLEPASLSSATQVLNKLRVCRAEKEAEKEKVKQEKEAEKEKVKQEKEAEKEKAKHEKEAEKEKAKQEKEAARKEKEVTELSHYFPSCRVQHGVHLGLLKMGSSCPLTYASNLVS